MVRWSRRRVELVVSEDYADEVESPDLHADARVDVIELLVGVRRSHRRGVGRVRCALRGPSTSAESLDRVGAIHVAEHHEGHVGRQDLDDLLDLLRPRGSVLAPLRQVRIANPELPTRILLSEDGPRQVASASRRGENHIRQLLDQFDFLATVDDVVLVVIGRRNEEAPVHAEVREDSVGPVGRSSLLLAPFEFLEPDYREVRVTNLLNADLGSQRRAVADLFRVGKVERPDPQTKGTFGSGSG